MNDPMKFAYADPPYYGMCGKFYEHYHPDGRCWDHLETHQLLVERLLTQYPDGWAMSMTVPSLWDFLPFIPRTARICSWGKTFCVMKKGVRPAYAWEPVILMGGRNENHPPPPKGGEATTPKDFLAAPIALKRGLTGAKPEAFCRWVLDLLGYQEGDEVTDLFPGTGILGLVKRQGVLI